MPSGPRIRANNVFGVISDNPLTSGATTFNSASLFLLPTVSSAHAIIVLDPKRVNGEPEIVVVTAHTALATSATITRGAYGTTAREHPFGTTWAHVVVTDDMIPVITSGTRPSDPFEGQFIYETDTDLYKAWNGSAWSTIEGLGNSRTITAAAAPPDLDVTLVSTFQNWGSAIVIPNPSIPVSVTAQHTGYCLNFTTASLHQVRIRISFDGGGSFTDGGIMEAVIGQGGTNINRGAVNAGHLRSGTPSGAIHIQVQANSVHLDSAFGAGFTQYSMVPT